MISLNFNEILVKTNQIMIIIDYIHHNQKKAERWSKRRTECVDNLWKIIIIQLFIIYAITTRKSNVFISCFFLFYFIYSNSLSISRSIFRVQCSQCMWANNTINVNQIQKYANIMKIIFASAKRRNIVFVFHSLFIHFGKFTWLWSDKFKCKKNNNNNKKATSKCIICINVEWG